MTRYEWLTITAIVLGPILALFAQRVLDTLRETKKRRVGLFFTLLTTRASPLAQAHVQALNSIDIVFAKDGDRPIRDAWQRVREQMSLDPTRPDWFDRLNDLKCDLLQVMGGAVGFDFTVDYLKRQGYLPKHYTDMEQDQLVIRQRMAKALTDDGIKVVVTDYARPPKPPKDNFS
jgi:hypothetical protein